MRITKVIPFIKRDFKIFISYPISMLFSLLSIFITLFIFYFLSKVISVGEVMVKYSSDYFSFVIIGIAFSSAVSTGLNTIVSSLRNEQMKGTFEMLLTGRLSTDELLLGFLSFNTLFEVVRLILTLLFAILFFDLKLQFRYSYISVIFLIFTFLTFLSFGIISAGIILITKRGNPLAFLINQSMVLFSGVYFPYEILPKWLRVFSYMFPTTYALKGIRLNLLKGYGFSMVYKELIIMIILSLILFPLSILFFKYALKKGKKWGTITTY